MNDLETSCTRGCAMRNQHLSECNGQSASGGTCHGCLPRRAQHGRLCWPCHRRLELMLTDADTVDRWLTGNMSGSGAAAAKQYIKHTKSDSPPMPIKAQIYDQRQLLRDHLSTWVDQLVELERLHGPDQHAPDKDAGYLLQWLDRIERWDVIGDLWEYTADMYAQAHALAPWRPEMKRLGAVPCPECAETNLAIFGGEADVTCLSCRTMILSKHYGIWESIVKGEVA